MHSEEDTKKLLQKIAQDELKRIRYLYEQGFTEEEIQGKLKAEGFVIEHDQQPARKMGNYRDRIEYDYYGWGATLYRNLYLH